MFQSLPGEDGQRRGVHFFCKRGISHLLHLDESYHKEVPFQWSERLPFI
jgi:hypothetical protein